MKVNHVALLFVFTTGLAAGAWLAASGQRPAVGQDQAVAPPAKEKLTHDTAYAESELRLTKAQLEYAASANERLGSGIFPATLIKQLELKRDVIQTYLAEQQNAEPNMQNVLIKKAEARLEIAQMRRDSEIIEGKRALLAIAVEVAEKRLERVKSNAMKDHEKQQDLQIGQLQLDLLNLRIDLDLIK